MAKKAGTAVAAKGSTIPANWKQKLKGLAKQEHERISVSAGNKMSLTKKGTFQYQGADLGNSVDCIILAFACEKQYYVGEYNKDNPGPPSCFALKLDEKNIAPHADSPEKQAEVCAECPHNEWGSSRRKGSRGKECKDKVRMALIHVDDIANLEDISQAEIAMFETPVTSSATFKKYAKRVIGASEMPLWALVTRLIADDKSDWEAIGTPELVETVPPGMLDGLERLAQQATEMVLAPFDVSGYKAGKGAKTAQSKKTAVKKRSRLS